MVAIFTVIAARPQNRCGKSFERLGIKPGGIDEAVAEPPPPANKAKTERTELDEVIPVTNPPADTGVSAESTLLDSAGASTEPSLFDEVPQREPSRLSRSAIALLADYVAYSGSNGPDPRTVSIGVVADSLCLIIEVEGPMIAKRAYDIYLRGCGIRRLGGELRSTMNKALAAAIRQERVISENEPGKSGLILSTVRGKDVPAVHLRRRGPRAFEGNPPGELRAVAKYLCEAGHMKRGSDEHHFGPFY